ncbi:hypothetical protein [Marinobacter alexandrii]|jgi:hypothetical protein|uniref:hypothetical protein n=1 Tax=Marinobacter alexandrii TaxID=2570351 RepID=UPI002ABE3F7C|nr:hypothetical protein [Marinobacter alexandrii]
MSSPSLFKISPPQGYDFDDVGSPVDAELRPIWRISILSLALYKLSRSKTATIRKLHAIYSIISSSRRKELINIYSISQIDLEVRLDPLVDKAILLAVEEDLFSIADGEKISLTSSGEKLAEAIWSDEELMKTEKEFLKKYKVNTFSENKISNYFSS